MVVSPVTPLSAPLRQYIEDELLRAPIWLNQLLDSLRSGLLASPGVPHSPAQRSAAADALAAAHRGRDRLTEAFVHQLRRQLGVLHPHADGSLVSAPAPGRAVTGLRVPLGLVEDEAVAVDVALAKAVEHINSAAEHELRELQTFTAALAGDMDFTRDHNPFAPPVVVRALWVATQELSSSMAQRLAFMRLAAVPLAQGLRRSYAASCSRLEAQGVVPAAYRTLVLPGGARMSRTTEITFSPELRCLRDVLPPTPDLSAFGTARDSVGYQGQTTPLARPMGAVSAPPLPPLLDRQALELVRHLFAAMAEDRRMPPDVQALLARLLAPTVRLARVDAGLMDRDHHPLWRFINRLVFAAEVTPQPADPERRQLLRAVKGMMDRISTEERQTPALYASALDSLQMLIQQRLRRRQTAAASQIGALQKLEQDLISGQAPRPGQPMAIDAQQLDTVPAALMDSEDIAPDADDEARAWLQSQEAGHWVRLFLQGQWYRAQLLWVGPQRQVWLFADGASDTTWAVRRSALLMMHSAALLKTLHQRSIVGSAAARVFAQQQKRDGGESQAA